MCGRPSLGDSLGGPTEGDETRIEDIVRFFVDRAEVKIEVRTDESRLRPVEVPEFLGSPEKARAELGWAAEIPLESSLGDVLEEWRRPRVAQPAE